MKKRIQVLAICCASFATTLQAEEFQVTISGSDTGRVFEGMGALSAGSNTRLLLDYPEPYRSDILDFLFKPKFGAGFQHLKVEIGGGENSTCGSEPSHAITADEQANPKPRGFEFWLMHEARKRNPKIILDCLPWSVPAWCGGAFTSNSAAWFVSFLDCAKKTYGLDLDYVGAGRNEHGTDRNWVVNQLRPALDKAGYSRVKLQGPDHNADCWKIFDQFAKDPAYEKAFDAVSYHIYYMVPSPDAAKATGKPLWMSEDTGSGSLAQLRSLIKFYVRDRVTKYTTWCPVAACYAGHTCFGDIGFVKAHEPWSGHYVVPEGVWYEAHVTQFAEPGWRFLDPGCKLFEPGDPKSAPGCLTLKDPDSDNWSLIASTLKPVTLSVKLGPGLATGPIHVWKTSGKDWFVQQPDLAVSNGVFTIPLAGNSAYSITTTTGQQKGQPSHPIPASAHFPVPYHEAFESYAIGSMPKYFMDQKGTFEVAADGRGGKCLKQILPKEGTVWGQSLKPNTIFGDQLWESYELGADVKIAGGDVEIGGHHNDLGKLGYRFTLGKQGQWILCYQTNVLATGTVTNFDGDAWHQLKLRFHRTRITGFVDGVQVASLANATNNLAGRCFLASTYDPNLFDNIGVNLLERPLPRARMSVSASSCYGKGHEAENVLDDRPGTLWGSAVSTNPAITLDLGAVQAVDMVSCLPRQDGNGSGLITAYTISVSLDGKTFTQVAAGSWAKTPTLKLAEFPATQARYLRLEAVTGVKGMATAAEINIYGPILIATALLGADEHPLQPQINRVLAREPAIQPTGLTRDDYLKIVDGQVRALRKYQRPDGELRDPKSGRTFYGPPCYAQCVATLAASRFDRDPELLESGVRAMDFSVACLARGKAAFREAHGDFFIYPVMLALEQFEQVVPAEKIAAWRKQLATVNPDETYSTYNRGGNNWGLVHTAGEFLRGADTNYVAHMLAIQQPHMTPLGLYCEKGAPFAYDAFSRYFLTGMLRRGYQDDFYREACWKGAWTSLMIQSPFGELPTGYRSAQHIWNEAELAAVYEIYAAAYAKAGKPREAGAFKRGARLALGSVRQWIRPDGSGYIVKNRFPITSRDGYEGYSDHVSYNLLCCSMLCVAWGYADECIAEKAAPADVGGFVIHLPEFHTIVANAAGSYVQYRTEGYGLHNPAGLVRVHLRGGNPQLGYSEGILHAIPAITDPLEVLEESPRQVRFRCRETLTLNAEGVTVATTAPVRFPMLVFDGLEETRVALQGNTVRLSLAGRGVQVVATRPETAVWQRSGKRISHRNGLVEEASVAATEYRISADPGADGAAAERAREPGNAAQPASAAPAVEVAFSGADPGRVFEGMGAVSAGGNTRLLLDYPEPFRSDILDFLFKPKFGVSFQHLKVEIGGGENSTCGSEPSHAITKEENANPKPRGFEFWLMHEARKRNPHIILDCLPWSYPAWCGGAFTTNSAAWYVSFLNCAKQTYGLDLDYVGAGWNERGINRNWVVNVLRPALDQAGYARVKLQGPDGNGEHWKICDQFANDPAYYKAIDAVSFHQYNLAPATDAAKASGKPLWVSENTGSGEMYKTREFVKFYVRDRITKFETWPPVAAVPIGHTYHWNTGFIKAQEPWSGHYEVPESLWCEAHITQFAEPGWKFLDPGCRLFDPANPKSDAGCLVLKDPNSDNWSLIAFTIQPVTLKVKLEPGLARRPIHVWRTNDKESFVQEPDLAVTDGAFTIRLEGNSAYSITTTTGQCKGRPPHPVPASSPFPAPYHEDFEQYAIGAMPKWFMDQKGTFEVAADGRGGKCLKQILPAEGTVWNDSLQPNTIFGDQRWDNYELSADVKIAGGNVALGGRHDDVGSKVMQQIGYRFAVSKTGRWELLYHTDVLATGSVPGFDGNAWHQLKVRFFRSQITGFIDGAPVAYLANATNSASGYVRPATPDPVADRLNATNSMLSGRCFLTSTYDPNLYDNLNVRLLPDAPLPRTKMTASASSCYRPGYEAANVLDGNPKTMWHSGRAPAGPFAQSITLDLGDMLAVNRLAYLPRQDGDPSGQITAYNLYAGADGKEFTKVASGTWARTPTQKLAEFPTTRTRYLKLEATAGVNGWAAAAEVNVYGLMP